MFGFTTGLNETVRVEGAKTLRHVSPAFIHALVGAGFAQRWQARIEAIHVLDPDFGPLTEVAAGIGQATQIDLGVGQVAQQHEVSGCQIRCPPCQHAYPDHGPKFRFMYRDGSITLGYCRVIPRRAVSWHGVFFPVLETFCKTKIRQQKSKPPIREPIAELLTPMRRSSCHSSEVSI